MVHRGLDKDSSFPQESIETIVLDMTYNRYNTSFHIDILQLLNNELIENDTLKVPR